MIYYDPGDWSIAFACSLRGSVFPKATAIAFPAAIVAVALHLAFEYPFAENVRIALTAGQPAANVMDGFSFILGFLVVFRSQQAYSRWWEGGTLLQQLRGEWFNSYSCLLAFCNSDDAKMAEVEKFQHLTVRLYSLLYGCALQHVSSLLDADFEILDFECFDTDSIMFLQDCADRCEVVLQWIQRLIVESEKNGILKVPAPILSRVFNELGNGIVNLNNARKITDFPMPFPLAQMITVMLLFHTILTAIVCAAVVDTPYWAGIITFSVALAYWSINYIAVELEMPYGGDANDLPLPVMQQEMNRSLLVLMKRKAQHVPRFEYDKQYCANFKMRTVNFSGELLGIQSKGSRKTVKGNSDGTWVSRPGMSDTAKGSVPPVNADTVDTAKAVEKMEQPPNQFTQKLMEMNGASGTGVDHFAARSVELTGPNLASIPAPSISLPLQPRLPDASTASQPPKVVPCLVPHGSPYAPVNGTSIAATAKFPVRTGGMRVVDERPGSGDQDLVELNFRMESHLSRIAHDLECITRRGFLPQSRAATAGPPPWNQGGDAGQGPWPAFLGRCS
eukprot:TRINITY_DN101660_c0_g1_i1.p1 TRINITY_DN101660_c0_g1~~TRINITY_DN101660_c0_g1_i1.p1  ORF type:complete len:562 (-),score=105.22 TRINITY_DN101660_c0_g1_i1:91-1776(-)